VFGRGTLHPKSKGDKMNRYLALPLFLAASLSGTGQIPAQTSVWSDSLLGRIRVAATMIPGTLPGSIHVLRLAPGEVPQSAFLDGGSNEPMHVTFSVFQIRFTDGWIMVDAGIDQSTFAARGPGPAIKIQQDNYELIQRALVDARSIVVTHEHDDHVGGVIRSPARDTIAPKTLLTRAQAQTLIDHPLNPAVRLDASSKDKYCIIDYDLLYPLAAGVVLIKAPGHTPGSQMVYVHLASGKEILLIGDITWAMAGIELQRLKPEATSKQLGEDRAAIKTEIGWLRNVTGKLNLVNSHDGDSIAAQIKQGVLEDGLDVQRP
jgi:glyoxylase-like metal-dependent hydrolase (beta-lactamase superfamily II)